MMIRKEELEEILINEDDLYTFDFAGIINDKKIEDKLYAILTEKERIAYFKGAKAALKIIANNYIDNMFV